MPSQLLPPDPLPLRSRPAPRPPGTLRLPIGGFGKLNPQPLSLEKERIKRRTVVRLPQPPPKLRETAA